MLFGVWLLIGIGLAGLLKPTGMNEYFFVLDYVFAKKLFWKKGINNEKRKMKKWNKCWNVLLIFRWSHDKYRKKPDYQFEPETGQMASRRNTLLHRSGILCVSRNNSIGYTFLGVFLFFHVFYGQELCNKEYASKRSHLFFVFHQRWTKWDKFVLPWYVNEHVIRHMWLWLCSCSIRKIFFRIFFQNFFLTLFNVFFQNFSLFVNFRCESWVMLIWAFVFLEVSPTDSRYKVKITPQAIDENVG